MPSFLRCYLNETRRPIYSAALILPFFVIYHLGTFLLHTTYVNGADALIVRLLSMLSVHSIFASAIVLLLCFIFWQLKSRASWRIESGRLFGLFAESSLYAMLLFSLTGWLSVHLSRATVPHESRGAMEKLVLYCGAGIYEELVFRGFLLGILLLFFAGPARMKRVPAAITAAMLAALIFSAFHYIGSTGDSFTLAGFLQRTFGGLFFSALFVTRGFGVTAACHALYDILVGLLLG